MLEELHYCDDEDSLSTDATEGPSSITIQRAIVVPASGHNIRTNPPPLYNLHHHPPTLQTPTQTPPGGSPVLSIRSDCSSHHSLQTQPFIPEFRSTLPSNMPYSGNFDFQVVVKDDEKPVPKTATFTYSSITGRVYIRRDTTVGITFSFCRIPTSNAIIRTMAIHKTPELVGDVLQCCAKHIEEQKKRGHPYPRHFICGASKSEVVYCEDPISGRLSITHCITSLQQKSETTLQAFFTFPCFTSELHKGHGQLAQLIFTLEINGHVVGRAVIDARICASPGRDRENDEAKLSPVLPSHPQFGSSFPSAPVESTSSEARRSRKRTSSNTSITQNIECSVPSKMSCMERSTQKETYTIETFPQLFPFIDVCVKMMERVHEVRVKENTGPGLEEIERDEDVPPTLDQEHVSFDSVESWLQYLDLSQYAPVLEAHGVLLLSQVIALDESELTKFGITNIRHKERLLEGQNLIKIAEDTQLADDITPSQSFSQQSHSTTPFIPSMLSQSSVSSGGPVEVLRIQIKKTFSSSSNSSNEL